MTDDMEQVIPEMKRRWREKYGKVPNVTRDLLGVSWMTDPFSFSPARKRYARWAMGIWEKLGFDGPVHDRRIHYAALAKGLKDWKGRKYRNDKTTWANLQNGIRDARQWGWMPDDAIVDARNPDPVITFSAWESPKFVAWADVTPNAFNFDIDAISLPAFPDLPEFKIASFGADMRPYLIEVWIEKSTMHDVLGPFCQQHKANLITFEGQGSSTRILEFMRRAKAVCRPARILYVSDWDKAGREMPASAARRIQFLNMRDNLGLDVRVKPVALLEDQLGDLPRDPVTKKKVELDALEVFRPGELVKLLKAAIKPYLPTAADKRRAKKCKQAVQDAIWAAGETGRLGELKEQWAELEERFDDHLEGIQQAFADAKDELDEIDRDVAELQDEITDEMQAAYDDPDVQTEFDVEGRADEDASDLFASTREYMDQVPYFNDWKKVTDEKFPKKSSKASTG